MPSSRKTPAKPRTRKPKETPTAVALRDWMKSFIEALGNGGLSFSAARVGMTPSGLLKLINRGSFHEPTLKCVTLLLEHKAELYPDSPVASYQVVNGYIFEERETPNGTVMTWRKA